MDKSIVQALHGLLPALSGPLSSHLVDLASSLLAQSRSRASSLKAEEEIARTYACANIACERLKQKLSLPKIEPRPPCPPRVYQKLYRYLDHILPAGGKLDSQSPGKNRHALTSKATPRKTLASATNSRRITPRAPIAENLPPWTMPVIRQLCQRLGAPRAPHHIFAGVSSIMKSSNESREPSEARNGIKLLALIIAVYFFATARLADTEIKSEQLVEQITISIALTEELAEQGFELEVVTETDVRAHMRQIALQKWVEMDWFQNIQLGSGNGADEDGQSVGNHHSTSDDDEEEEAFNRRRNRISRDPKRSERKYLLPGLGTMMQERVNFLSDEHMRDYQEWKMVMMMRIQEMEKDTKA